MRRQRAPKPWLLPALTRAAILVAFVFVIGLPVFVSTLERSRSTPPQADGIVALTGGDGRLQTAIKLLSEGRGRRLLISGVHEDATREALASQVHDNQGLFGCCVDLGRSAINTIGNASEAAQWARAHRYRSLIVVTAAYHMPRSLMEFEAAMPDVKLIAQPVFPEDMQLDRWWESRQSASILAGEYGKYVLSLARLGAAFVLGFDSARPAHPMRIDRAQGQPNNAGDIAAE